VAGDSPERKEMKVALDAIDRRLGKPLYAQFADAIRGAIQEGHFKPGERLPSERAFMHAGGLSYPTVARALHDVAEEGLLRRKVGCGTFVSDPLPVPQTTERTVGVVYCEANEFFQPIFAGVEEELRDVGYHPTPLFEGRQEGGEDHVLRRLGEDGACGLIAIPSRVDAKHRELIRLVTQHFPVVLMDSYLPDIMCDAVTTDNEAAMEAMTDYLLGLGHRRIGFITETVQYPYSTSVRERNAGVKRALDRAGVPDPEQWIIPYGPSDLSVPQLRANVEQVVETLFARSQDQKLTAIMCVTDDIARGVVRCLRRRGLRVPQDVSVTGFDDLAWSAEARPPLTTVRQPLERIGRRAVRLLLERLHHPGRPAIRIVLDYQLVIRASTAAPPPVSTSKRLPTAINGERAETCTS
jgi:DNA-binding LacI/PurR family transcriptional regulator